jgi:hypothetical protein
MCTADVYEDRLDLIGVDALESMVFNLDKEPAAALAQPA